MSGWIDDPEDGRLWDSGCVAVVDDPEMLDDPIMRALRDDEYVAACSPDQWHQHLLEEARKDRIGTAIREAELEGWDDHADELRRLRGSVAGLVSGPSTV